MNFEVENEERIALLGDKEDSNQYFRANINLIEPVMQRLLGFCRFVVFDGDLAEIENFKMKNNEKDQF